ISELVHVPTDAARIVALVADTTDQLHKNGLIHRDIKPANILLQHPIGESTENLPLTRYVPLLTDFGLVKRIGDAGSTQTGEILGTPDFMAPEMIRSSKDAMPAVDIFS